MSSILTHLKNAKLSAADRKLIADTIADYTRISNIATACQGPRGAWDPEAHKTALHAAVDVALAELQENPSLEAAEKLHCAIVRREHAALSHDIIRDALHAPLVKTSQKLAPLAKRILADAEAEAKATAATQREALVSANVDKVLVAQHEQALASTLAGIEGELKSVESHPIQFFLQFGIGI